MRLRYGAVCLGFFLVLAALSAPLHAQNATDPFEQALNEALSSQNGIVKKAAELKRDMDQANKKDLAFLHKRLAACSVGGASLVADPAFLAKVIAKLKADKETYAKIKQALDAKTGGERGSPELRTTLGKLIGTSQQPGILDDAIALLEDPARRVLEKTPEQLAPTHNQITVLKTLLLYALIVAEGKENASDHEAELDREIQLLYPAAIPAHVDPDLLKCTGLACVAAGKPQLKVPNAGFVFGAGLVDKRCRGLDCSAFVSHCTDTAQRLSTMVLEYTWRELANGATSFNAPELTTRQEFLDRWGMKESLTEFTAVNLAKGDLPKPGDLVVWRWNKAGGGRDGHVVIYLAPVPNSTTDFYSIEDNREEDKTLEGVAIRQLKLARSGADTYILRRK